MIKFKLLILGILKLQYSTIENLDMWLDRPRGISLLWSRDQTVAPAPVSETHSTPQAVFPMARFRAP